MNESPANLKLAEPALVPSVAGAGTRARSVQLALLLMAMSLLAFSPAVFCGFIWDDNDHITENQTLRSVHGLWQIWFEPGATCQYYPLTFTVFWVGYQIWGLHGVGYHLLNIVMHGIVAIALWRVLVRLNVRGAWLGAALFALHPVCVMSVVWATELKNTLSAALALGAACAYLWFAGLGANQPVTDIRSERHCWRYYFLCVVLFQLALFAKTAVSFLPASLLLVMWWKRDGLRWSDVWPLLPMFGTVAAMGWLTFHIEHLHGAAGEPFHLSFWERVLVSGRSFWFYFGKLIFPWPLVFIYERWNVDAGAVWQYVYPLATILLFAVLWRARGRTGKGVFVMAAHFYIGTSFLILLVVLYMTRYTFVSDHWQYFGCMSVFAAAGAGLTRLLAGQSPGRMVIRRSLCGALLLLLGVMTWRQCAMYANPETLWTTTLKRNPRCFIAYNNLGCLVVEHRTLDGMDYFRRAIEVRPDFAEAHYNLGNALVRMGRMDEAAEEFEKALAAQPDYAEAYNNLGGVLLDMGRPEAAAERIRKALQFQPELPEAHLNMGRVLAHERDMPGAEAEFRVTLRLEPRMAAAHSELGDVLLRSGRARDAVVEYRTCLKLQLGNPRASWKLAWVLATSPEPAVRNGTEAIALAEQSRQLTYGADPAALKVLAAAYAEAGRFSQSVKTARRALELAAALENASLADLLRKELANYEADTPCRADYPAP